MGDREEDKSVLTETLRTESNCKRVNPNAEELFEKNQPLVSYVLSKLGIGPGNDYEDLQQQGYIGLWDACLHFDDSKGFQFATYAVPMIKGTVLRYMREKVDPVRIPRSHKTIKSVMNKHGFTLPLSEEEIAIIVAETDKTISESTVRKYRDTIFTSFDAPLSEDDGKITLGDIVSDNKDFRDDVELFSEEQVESTISEILEYISDKSVVARDVVEEYLYASMNGVKLNQTELGKKYNISQCHCSRIIKQARKIFKEHEEEIHKLLGII